MSDALAEMTKTAADEQDPEIHGRHRGPVAEDDAAVEPHGRHRRSE